MTENLQLHLGMVSTYTKDNGNFSMIFPHDSEKGLLGSIMVTKGKKFNQQGVDTLVRTNLDELVLRQLLYKFSDGDSVLFYKMPDIKCLDAVLDKLMNGMVVQFHRQGSKDYPSIDEGVARKIFREKKVGYPDAELEVFGFKN